jgi:hypothetical protein
MNYLEQVFDLRRGAVREILAQHALKALLMPLLEEVLAIADWSNSERKRGRMTNERWQRAESREQRAESREIATAERGHPPWPFRMNWKSSPFSMKRTEEGWNLTRLAFIHE